MRGQTIAQACVAVLFSLILAACGGGGPSISLLPGGSSSSSSSSGSSSSGSSSSGSSSGTTSSSSSGSSSSACTSVNLLASSNQLPSAASQQSNGVTLSALCKDGNNNAVSGASITFAASAGLVQVTQGTTDATGTALAVLTTGGDVTNQTVTVKAANASASSSQLIAVEGTSVQIAGASVIGSGTQSTYTVTLSDSSNKGVPNQKLTVTSALGNTITSTSLTTDTSGHATFVYTGVTGGSDTLTVASTVLNANGTFSVAVSGTTLTFTQPSNTAQAIPFNTPTSVQIKYINKGSPVAGATVNFSTSRGTLSSTAPATPCTKTSSSPTSLSATTDSSGLASVFLCTDGSQGAGGVIFTAAVSGGGPSASVPLTFSATTAAAITVEATPSTIAPTTSSTVRAIVYDKSDNLVQGQVVNFTLTDPTGGSLSAASGVTDQSGTVSVIYTATKTSSAQGGVQISASVNGTSIVTPNPAKITVGGQALRITLGTGNTISVLDATRYQLPYSVIITDSAGNPVPNATFNLTLQSVAYQKGFMVFSGGVWSPYPPSLVPASDNDFNSATAQGGSASNILYKLPFGCITEDPTNSGIFNPQTMDYNGNGALDPGAVASVPPTVALDSTGSAQFFITYPKDHAYWVEVLLTGTASVAGTETTATAEFVLAGIASDYTSATTAPPGEISPYGDGANEPPKLDPTTGNEIVTANNCKSPN